MYVAMLSTDYQFHKATQHVCIPIINTIHMDAEIFRLARYLQSKLWSFKFIKLDACGRPLYQL